MKISEKKYREGVDLVPFMPILVCMNACASARAAIVELNVKTFSELWLTDHTVAYKHRAAQWRGWLLEELHPGVFIDWYQDHNYYVEKFSVEQLERRIIDKMLRDNDCVLRLKTDEEVEGPALVRNKGGTLSFTEIAMIRWQRATRRYDSKSGRYIYDGPFPW